MTQSLGLVSLVVRDYDEALAFFVGTLGFRLVEDTPVPEQAKRWVVVSPPGGASGAQLLLARASTPGQEAHIGDQTGGRVFLFLHTDDLARDYADYRARGVEFVREPEQQPYGTVAVFCDLRGFTAFSARAAPEEVMSVLAEYYEALGSIITKYAATLTSFSGDGLMVLVNAPVPVEEPALRAVDLAVEMQRSVQELIIGWRARGHRIGFGVGLAMGPATVGRIGYESRFDYTAIGSVVNLAARLCASAADEEILTDEKVAEAVKGRRTLTPLGPRSIKGYDEELPVFGAAVNERPSAA